MFTDNLVNLDVSLNWYINVIPCYQNTYLDQKVTKTSSFSMYILLYDYNIYDIYGICLTGRISYHTRVCGSDKNGWVEKDPIDQIVIYIIFVYWDVFVEDDIFRFLEFLV